MLVERFEYTVEAGYTAGIWGHHEHPRYKLTLLQKIYQNHCLYS
jgi:hypothetical protein